MNIKQDEAVISKFLQSIDQWRNVVVIGGGYALIIYQIYFADKTSENYPVGTNDIDSLIPRKVPSLGAKTLATHLEDNGFVRMFKDRHSPATESYIAEVNGNEIEIEFLTDSSTRGNKKQNVSVAGVVAQPLNYLNMSIENVKKFQTASGETGFVVDPGAWVFHKGLTFIKRKQKQKAVKDLYGIWYVTTQLGAFSKEAIESLQTLCHQHKSWCKRFKKNLENWVERATPLNWNRLEMQDPTGNLRKENFVDIVKKLSS